MCRMGAAPNCRLRAPALALALLTMLLSSEASAQRTGENAVTEAEDAFGVTIGRESLGLYTGSSVRGFSPTAAGNVRIDGLYFDQVWGLNSRVRRTTRIRVGPSAQSYPFPAPTGIVDQSLKIPDGERAASVLVSGDGWGSKGIEADLLLPVSDEHLSMAIGAAAFEEEFHNGTSGEYWNAGGSIRWSPTPALEIVPFGARSEARDDEIGPIYVPAGAFLPVRVERREFDGPWWADYEGTAINYGVLTSYEPATDWTVRLGVFRSLFDDDSSYANLLLDLQPDGSAQRLLVADPPTEVASTSGELRITRRVSGGDFLHFVHLSARARDRERRYDGSVEIDLGPYVPGLDVTTPRPEFAFGAQTHDHIEQQTAGIAYELRWRQRGELGAGLQRTFYEKRVTGPTLNAQTESQPWLYNVAGAYALNEWLTFYASYTRGLEESGVAPDTASNRGEALPAIRTRQADAGVRIALTPTLKLLAGAFDVTKPYFSLDEQNRFRALGEVSHRGLEISLAGSVAGQLDIVAGAVVMDPRVTGPDVDSGTIGSRPVGQPKRNLQLNLDWRPQQLANLSFDATANYTSGIPATRDNSVELPTRTVIDVGGRYRFKVGRAPATLRVSVANATDVYGYELRGSGAYDVPPGRQASAYVAVDW